MAGLFVQFLAVCNNDNLPNSKIRLQILPITSEPSKKVAKEL